MAKPAVFTKTLAAASDNKIALSQTPAAAGNLTLNGAAATGSPAVAVLDTQRQVLITFAGDEHTKTVTLYGTNQTGGLVQETIQGTTPGTVVSTQEYLTITRIAVSAAFAGAVKVGTNGVGATPWYNFNTDITPTNTSINVQVTGTVNYTVQYTFDDPNAFTQTSTGVNVPVVPTTLDDAILAGQTATNQTYPDQPYWGVRCLINSGTGTVKMTVIQAGIAGP